MFKHRLTKFGVSSLFAIVMLFVGGSMQSCQDWLDVYPYDDPGDPEWLGSSVYEFLKKGTADHSYSNYVAIIDSLGEKETLAHTGSKTLFVADDEAFETFFRNNDWVSRNGERGVKSVGEMTKSQMKMILYNSMLDNAMLLDMLSSSGVDTNQEGTTLRRWTSLTDIDTIPLIKDGEVPNHPGWPTYNTYWDVLRGKERVGEMRIAMDGSRSMMVHFIGDYLRKKSIKASDIEFLFKKQGKTFVDGDAFIYGNKIVSSDVTNELNPDDKLTITCKNGYIYRLDELLVAPSNMAEELRKHPDTRIFSHLLDRYCVPEYDDALSNKFNAYYKTNDSVFKLRYFSESYQSHPMLASTNKNPTSEELLIFDPGQNSLLATNTLAGEMGSMFVPSDEILYDYFANPDSAGHFLLSRFAPSVKVPVDHRDIPALLSALDSVPQLNITPFINNLMKKQFSATVLSKFDKIYDDANELMGIRPEHVDECVIANNGVIYILNSVFGPAKYQAVVAPTYVYENMDVMRQIVQKLRYDYYLLAMDAHYTYIVPDDDHSVYFDPLATSSTPATAYFFHYDTKRKTYYGSTPEFWATKYKFNPATYELGDSVGEALYDDENAMKDLLENLILVHDDKKGIYSGNKYFLTKGYATIKVDLTDTANIKFQGGEQLERDTYVKVASVYNQRNGVTYNTLPGEDNTLSAIPTPPTRSVYDNLLLKANSEFDTFYQFYKICYPGEDYMQSGGLLSTIFDITGKDKKALQQLADSAARYSIFYTDERESGMGGTTYTKNTVPFFNIFHYTVYVPSNASIIKAHDNGLPTWEQVKAVAEAGDKAKAIAMMRSIINFAKYHFQDNSVYVDNLPIKAVDPITGLPVNTKKFTTAAPNEKTRRFYELVLESEGDTYVIHDGKGNKRKVLVNGTENKDWNIMCRDNILKIAKDAYESSSYAVLQPIDSVLLNESMFGYDGRFKRFANNGLSVDLMDVDGTGPVEVAGKNYYLVAKMGNIRVVDINGVEDICEAGYLMLPLDENDEKYDASLTREKLVVDQSQNILVTDEGYWVKASKDKKGLYEYVTKTKEGNIYIVRYKYNNEKGAFETEEVKVGEVPEEGTDNN